MLILAVTSGVKARRRRDLRIFLLHVRVLVLCEVRDLDIVHIFNRIAYNKTVVVQLLKHLICFLGCYIVIAEQSFLDAPWSIFQPPFPVCDTPQPDKEQPGERWEVSEYIVVEERWLDISGSCHVLALLSPSAHIDLCAGQPLDSLFDFCLVPVVIAHVADINLL